LEKIEMISFGGAEKFFVSFGESLAKNPTIPLNTINFSDNK